jgi:hypothetical protein
VRWYPPLLAALMALLLLPSAASALVIGIGDQKPDMFRDQRFAAMGIRYARVSVGWDVLTSPWQTQQLDAWMAAAHAAGVEPLLSFGHSRGPARRVLPSPSRFTYEFRRIRTRYPWVRTFATWNEANHCGEPTCHRPQLVAAYWRSLRRECPKCTILAAEVLDEPNMVSWVKAFQRTAKIRPKWWGLHNYLDANRMRTTGTRALLRAVKGQVWFTETGGIVARRNRSKVAGFPETTRHAATAIDWVFRRLVPLSRRVTRVYLYHWNAQTKLDTWDSALIAYNGRIRPGYRVVQKELFTRALARLRQPVAKRVGRKPPR